MNAKPHLAHCLVTLGAALALGASAATRAAEAPSVEPPIVLAQAAPAAASVRTSDATPAYPSLEAGVRRAAAEGPDALRRYVFRTRMIYNYYIVDFISPQ